MLYHADPFQIDVQIEAKSGNRILVTGQLLESNNPAISCYDVRVTLSNMRGNTVHVVTNQFGEFSGDVENSGRIVLGCCQIKSTHSDSSNRKPGRQT